LFSSERAGKFSIKTNVPAPDYYVIRVGEMHTNIILRDSSKIKVYGDKKKLKEVCNFVGSDESQAMNQFAIRMEKWNVKRDSAYKAMNTMHGPLFWRNWSKLFPTVQRSKNM